MNLEKKSILNIEPVFKQMVWGGNRLASEFSYQIPGDHTGECWGISGHPHGDCKIKDGIYEGKHLSEMWKEHPELFGNIEYDRFPILTKILDANRNLSVQVHPDDDYAMKNENGSWGKTESWYILDCKENATLVIGHNAKTRTELAEMIHQKRWKDLMREVSIHKGDFIQLNPGTVHTIESGTLILETQRNSDITYRVYDYDREIDGKKRELHIDKSIDVITVPAEPVKDHIKNVLNLPVNKLNILVDCGFYKVFKLQVSKEAEFEQSYPFLIMSVVNGFGKFDGREIRKGDHFIIPYQYGNFSIEGDLEIIASSL